MNKLKIVLFSLVFSLLLSLSGKSQVTLTELNDLSNIKIDSYSDDQLSYFLQNSNGANVSDIYQHLSEKGLPDAELQKLKSRIQNLSNKPISTSPASEISNPTRTYNQSESTVPMEENKKD